MALCNFEYYCKVVDMVLFHTVPMKIEVSTHLVG